MAVRPKLTISIIGFTTGMSKVMICRVAVPSMAIMSEGGEFSTIGGAVKVVAG
jgi:hypothetical protein